MDPTYAAPPPGSSATSLAGFSYQEYVTLAHVLTMFSSGQILHVTCEHFEDILVARSPHESPGLVLWDFQQIKSRQSRAPWTLSDVLDTKSFKSLLRTHRALVEHVREGAPLKYRLTAGLEGVLADEPSLRALALGEGAADGRVVDRLARRLEAGPDELRDFLGFVRIEELPRRDILELRCRQALFDLAAEQSVGEVDALRVELLNKVREAMLGQLGPRWPVLTIATEPGDLVVRKRLSQQSLAAEMLRLGHPILADFLCAARRVGSRHPGQAEESWDMPGLDAVYVPQRLQVARRPEEIAVHSAHQSVDHAALGNDPLCLVVAGPGGGKSSFLAFTQARSAEQWATAAPGTPLAVAVSAAELLDAPLAEALAAAATKHLALYGLSRTLPAEFFRNRPGGRAPWLVLVDGLDEVADPARRRELLRALSVHVAKQPDPLYRFVVTTRPLSDSDLQDLPRGMPNYWLLPFTNSDLKAAAAAWFQALGLPQPEEAVKRFYRALKSARLSEFVRNPLMAAMLCRLYATQPNQALPQSRGALYCRFTDLLYLSMHTRGEAGARHQASLMLERFGRTALDQAEAVMDGLPTMIDALAVRPPASDEQSWAEALTSFEQARCPRAVLKREWKSFLGFVVRRSGLFTEALGELVFLHPTLQEFCAARHIQGDSSIHEKELRRLLAPWQTDTQSNPWSAPLETASYIGFLVDAGDAAGADAYPLLDSMVTRGNLRGCLLVATLFSLGCLFAKPWEPLVNRASEVATQTAEDHAEDPVSRVWAATLLSSLDPGRGHALLEKLAHDEDQDASFDEDPHDPQFSPRFYAADTLLDLCPQRGADVCFRLSHDETLHDSVRLLVARRLAEANDVRAADAVAQVAAADIHFDSRFGAALLLASLQRQRGANALYELIEDYWGDSDWTDYCHEAAHALAGMGDGRAERLIAAEQ